MPSLIEDPLCERFKRQKLRRPPSERLWLLRRDAKLLRKKCWRRPQAPAVLPGLPSSSTWASGASPVTPGGNGASVWAKPAQGKVATQPVSSSKKTLQQIQKEEESRKQRAAAQAAAAASAFGAAVPVPSAGKRYADLAGKTNPIHV